MKLDNAGLLLREYSCVVKELNGTHLFGTCKQITTHNSLKTVEFVIPNSTCSVVWKVWGFIWGRRLDSLLVYVIFF
jgi:hypothetical protein